ncbi:restriction endonuclease subunit S [bacterium endosymbiont of Bathymodiolus sp. 5 South]|uniref:restriction endonuclease subunit S n=1 Tax=bacterium endosymbiont of Bathymodiolus sp. 5 South TaxID=1181670 RepID=UPI0010B2EBE5|nr:restriction endonuclease subunit S [bacterium endosymbiont of Bathymodiolus sp. 5 South]SSC08821.1 Type I restriction-modification system, specificity subunit S [bacterium endosymbiont of Bathymodiolus sp. 5 South]
MMSRLVPKLRFKEFGGEWEDNRLGNVYKFFPTKSFPRDKLNYEKGKVKNIHYGDIHTKFSTLFDITKETVPYINQSVNISNIKKNSYCLEGDIVFADASEDLDDIGKSIELINLNNESLLAGLHTLLARQIEKNIIKGFTGYLFKSNSIRNQIKREAQGAKVLGLSVRKLENISISFPKEKKEQQKIASCLSSLDALIEAQNKKVSVLKQHKKGLMQQLFPAEGKREPKLRFKAFSGEWVEKKLGDCLGYLQPTKYLVSDTNYNDDYDTPVLTAGKTFILGYTNEKSGIFKNNLPVIIFDDFTTATKYVDFPFKAKSSAMKILLAKESMNIKFMYELMQMIKYEVGNHERHWISKFALLDVLIPTPKEQQKIANTLSTLDNLIEAQDQKITQLKQHKKGLMQQLFVSSEVAHE